MDGVKDNRKIGKNPVRIKRWCEMIERKYQTFWPRFWAGWIDALIFFPLTLLNDFMVMKVKVLDITESSLSMFQAFKREIVPIFLIVIGCILDFPKMLSGVNIMDPNIFQYDATSYLTMASIFGWFILEMVTMLFSKKRRALHDIIGGSVVIRLPQPANTAAGCFRSGSHVTLRR